MKKALFQFKHFIALDTIVISKLEYKISLILVGYYKMKTIAIFILIIDIKKEKEKKKS